MRLLSILLIFCLVAGCKKNKTCYDCYTNDGSGARLEEEVCTDGNPRDKLPRTNVNGNLSWVCAEQ